MNRSELEPIVAEYAKLYRLDPAIVFGVCIKESCTNPKSEPSEWRVDPKAQRFEKSWCYFYNGPTIPGVTRSEELRDQATSWGLMQVMGAVLRERGYAGIIPDIKNDVRAQMDYGCRHLHSKIKRYGLEYGILSYNQGSPRKDKFGGFLPVDDQPKIDYLRKVLRYAKEWPADAE